MADRHRTDDGSKGREKGPRSPAEDGHQDRTDKDPQRDLASRGAVKRTKTRPAEVAPRTDKDKRNHGENT